jgi:hypothetical protein
MSSVSTGRLQPKSVRSIEPKESKKVYLSILYLITRKFYANKSQIY